MKWKSVSWCSFYHRQSHHTYHNVICRLKIQPIMLSDPCYVRWFPMHDANAITICFITCFISFLITCYVLYVSSYIFIPSMCPGSFMKDNVSHCLCMLINSHILCTLLTCVHIFCISSYFIKSMLTVIHNKIDMQIAIRFDEWQFI